MTFRPEAKLDPSRVKDNRRRGAVTRYSDRPAKGPHQAPKRVVKTRRTKGR